ncbi:TrlF family AAA-like ATPase [Chryseolinea sp. H1M3-3]|uniref:TrlF family AAA-like ATPase n=1 Tax=Chryseolinea sp. H1M3-3 TaxID=3034144 RepID=UPI0023EB687A|nr:AAA family ATPase [Chryseolinea sp. H1M3-3]
MGKMSATPKETLTPPVNTQNPRGSIWHRWEPHIHAPGTVLNNQFNGDDPWEDFLTKIENSNPRIRALGVTDYYLLDLYERVIDEKSKGRLSEVDLIFPNIELRFSIETAKGKPINAHLLVSQEDDNHVVEIKRFINRLTYKIGDDAYNCNAEDLKKLGRKHSPQVTDDRKALEIGVNQFKVNYEQLHENYNNTAWAKKNILIAISGSSGDGTPGLKDDAAFASLRTELERTSHIIFSSNENQRKFWLGQGAATKQELSDKWNGCKPCLHGSDAHDNDNVGVPSHNRYSWIKGDLRFESLRQACIEPEIRTFIGSSPPAGSMPSYTIEAINIKNAEWLTTSSLRLNPGLTTIIGARGSGKTALADLIAVAGYSAMPKTNDRSFIMRAKDLFADEIVELNWLVGEQSSSPLSQYVASHNGIDSVRVQYLSQQFVDQLCSAEGLTDELMDEIERVIFEAHIAENRMGATSFSELVGLKSESVINLRCDYEREIEIYTSEINSWREKKNQIPNLQKSLDEKTKTIENDKRDRQTFIGKNSEERVKQHQKISTALDAARVKLDAATRKHSALTILNDYIEGLIKTGMPNALRNLKEKHSMTGLTDLQWENFQLEHKGDVVGLLKQEITKASINVQTIKGAETPAGQQSDFSNVEDLSRDTFNELQEKQSQIQKLIGVDEENSLKFKKLSEKIAKDEATVVSLKKEIEDCGKADEKITHLLKLRQQSYKGVFDTLLKHEQILTELYKPLMENLQEEDGALGKLTFNVQRKADLDSWAAAGEALLDLRKGTIFRGKGALREVVQKELLPAWEQGTADDVSKAMNGFLDIHRKSLEEHSPIEKTDRASYREWANKVAAWLFDTSHISIKYGIQYDGVNIHQLSSGTRGIVLLLLYLAIDKDDFRPLIIDQPEENLDPKSIFDELVPRFRSAKLRRQIIIVTHNANLVVNTDADQVIVANCGDHRQNQLPLINYVSGGIENDEIRKQVCEILEGGEEAFKERAKRLRVRL